MPGPGKKAAWNKLNSYHEKQTGTRTFSGTKNRQNHPKWGQSLQRGGIPAARRKAGRYKNHRDYSRILHCTSYRRLKHKTQVFFCHRNDHICTRMEHVKPCSFHQLYHFKIHGTEYGTDTAIALGHDLGHSPFGHEGEPSCPKSCNNGTARSGMKKTACNRQTKSQRCLMHREFQNLRLTYAVRDGSYPIVARQTKRTFSAGRSHRPGTDNPSQSIQSLYMGRCVVKLSG